MKLIAFILALSFAIGISLVGMLWGWGLEPKSWGWVMFSYVTMCIPSALSVAKDA